MTPMFSLAAGQQQQAHDLPEVAVSTFGALTQLYKVQCAANARVAAYFVPSGAQWGVTFELA